MMTKEICITIIITIVMVVFLLINGIMEAKKQYIEHSYIRMFLVILSHYILIACFILNFLYIVFNFKFEFLGL